MNDRTTASHLLAQADALLSLGCHTEALPLIGKALTLDPENCDALCRLGVIHLEAERYDEAIDAASQAIAADPDEEWGYRIGAIALLHLGRRREALDMATECVRCAPDLPAAIYTLAQVQTASNMSMACGRTLAHLTTIAPEWAPTWELRAVEAMERKEPEEAKEYAARALQIDPTSNVARNMLGMASLRMGDQETALRHFVDASRVRPNDSRVHDNIVAATGERHHRSMLILRIVLIVGIFLLGAAWLRGTHPPPLSLLVALLYGIAGAVATRSLLRTSLPPHNAPFVDLEPRMRHRYTRWIPAVAVIGLHVEWLMATRPGGYITLPPGARSAIGWGITIATFLATWILMNKPTVIDTLVARPFVAWERWREGRA